MTPEEAALIRNIQTHDLAESLRIRRAAEAGQQGLPPQAFALPFPGNQVIHVGNSMNLGQKLWQVASVILGSVVVSGVVWGGVGAIHWFQSLPKPSQAYQVQIEYQAPDGSWKPIGQPQIIRTEK